MSRLVKYAINCLIVCVTVILLFLTISSIFYTADFITEPFQIEDNEKVVIYSNNPIIILLLLCVAILILYGVYKVSLKIKINKLCLFVCLSIFILSIIWIIFAKNNPRDDQLAMTNSASYLFKNNMYMDFEKGYYFWIYPFQLGYVLFLETIFMIYNSMYFIQMMNAIFVAAIAFCIYYITKQIFSYKNNENKLILILLLGYLYFEFISTFIYGNIPGLMFSLISIIFLNKYLENAETKYICFSGIFIIIANIVKPNYLIFLVAEIIILVLDTIVNKRIKNIFFICLTIFLLSVCNMGIKNFYEIRTGKKLTDGMPRILHVNMGLNDNEDRANGWYDGSTIEIFEENNWDIEKTKKDGNERVKNRIIHFIQNPSRAYKFFREKMLTQWIEPTHQTIWINIPLKDYDRQMNEISLSLYSKNGTLNKLLDLYFAVYQLMIYSMSTIYFIKNVKTIDYKQSLLILIFFGGFLFQIFWEAKSLYTIIFTILLLPYAAKELEDIFKIIDEKIVSKICNG